jgi:hypothetical protein
MKKAAQEELNKDGAINGASSKDQLSKREGKMATFIHSKELKRV